METVLAVAGIIWVIGCIIIACTQKGPPSV